MAFMQDCITASLQSDGGQRELKRRRGVQGAVAQRSADGSQHRKSLFPDSLQDISRQKKTGLISKQRIE